MGQILKGQVIASTRRDLHGERLSKGELEELFSGMPSQRLLNYNHDPRRPPIARAFNNRFERLTDGEYAIKSDIEVLDEEIFPKIGGFSIAFTRRPVSEDKSAAEPDLVISFNPRQVEAAQLQDALDGWDSLSSKTLLLERSEKAIDAGILLIWFIVSQGFWSAMGADLYRFAKSLIKTQFSPEKPTEVAFKIETATGEPEVVVCVDEDSNAQPQLNVPAVIEEAQALAPGNEILKIVVDIDSNGNSVINYAVDVAGTILGPQRP